MSQYSFRTTTTFIFIISGVWAKDSDEEDNEDNIRQRTRKPKDFSAPIGFVAGGVQQAGKKKEEKKGLLPVAS